jgi:glycosyltransferase involved in cell wall biosynthesis
MQADAGTAARDRAEPVEVRIDADVCDGEGECGVSEEKLVSVIIPAYNPGPYLREAVTSVLGQTYGNWELVVVDDGSTEDISNQIPKDRRIELVRQSNMGLSMARNAGIMKSRGGLVAFLDADDVWLPEKLQRQMKVLEERPEAVLCHSQMRLVDGEGRPGGLGWGGGYETYEELLDGCGVCISSVLMRRETLFACGLFDPLLKSTQDYDLWLKAGRLGRLAAIRDALVDYRWHGGNMSGNYMQVYRELMFILSRHEWLARQHGRRVDVSRCIRGMRRVRRNTVLQAVNAMRSAGPRRGGNVVRHLLKALQVSPMLTGQELFVYVSRKMRGGHLRTNLDGI